MTALDVLSFATAVMMIIVYSQCWLMAVQGDKGGATDSAFVRAMFFPAYAGGMLLLALSPGQTVRAWLRQPLLIVIMMVVAASMLWSINPDQTFRRAVALIMTTLGGVVIAARWRWARLAEVVAAAHGLLAASDVFLAVLGKDATLTGRTKIWAAVMRRIQERPWLGYGYAAVWSDTDTWAPLAWITRQAGFRAFHAHNSWLEQWLGLGVVGLGAWSLYFLEVWTRALIALYRSAGAYLAIPFLLVYSMTTLTESIALTFNDSRWLIFVAIAVKLALPEDAGAVQSRQVRVRIEPVR